MFSSVATPNAADSMIGNGANSRNNDSAPQQVSGLMPRGVKGHISEALKAYAQHAIPSDAKKEEACRWVMSQVFGREAVLNAEQNDAPIIMLIGGWAVYAKSGLRKSHDIDVVVSRAGWNDLQDMARENGWAIKYNPALRKHEVKARDPEGGVPVDIDAYVAYEDKLLIPPAEMISAYERYSVVRSLQYLDLSVRMVSTEALIAMKLVLSMDSGRVKDAVDVAGLVSLMVQPPNMHKVGRILYEHLEDSMRLGRCLRHFSDLMDEMVKGTITFSSTEEQERTRQLIDGLDMELKEGVLNGNPDLQVRAMGGDLFRKKE